MSDMRHRRYASIIDPEMLSKLRVGVVGAGAIGTALIVNLAKMGVRITVWDPDKVAPVNLGIQWFGNDDVGKQKVHAIRGLVQQLGCSKITAIPSRFSVPKKPLHPQRPLPLP